MDCNTREMKDLLKGFVDIHLHAGPSVAQREVDAGDMMKIANEYEYRAYVVKDHFFPTAMSAKLVEKHVSNKNGVKVFGGIALNNSVGVFNLKAVDTAYDMGAKIVYMPTVSAKNHIDMHKGHFLGAGHPSVEEEPVRYIDADGKLDPAAVEVIEYVSKRPDLVLATGHGCREEVDAVIETACKLGVEKILVNHPYFLVNASADDMARWANMGAYIELNACLLLPHSLVYSTSIDEVREILKKVPHQQIVIDSDLGQKGNGNPAIGLYQLCKMLMEEASLTEAEIEMMGKENPAMLLGL
jgi:hypothetical protein